MLRDVVDAFDFSEPELRGTIDLARQFFSARIGQGPWPEMTGDVLSRFQPAAKMTNLYLEPSSRTRGSYGESGRKMPMDVYECLPAEWLSMAKKESFARTVVTLAQQGSQIIVQRTPWKGSGKYGVRILAKYGWSVSTHCGGDSSNQHPSQGVLDCLTIDLVLPEAVKRSGKLRVGTMGDAKYSRVLHSTIPMLQKLYPGLQIFAVSEEEARLDPYYCCGAPLTESTSMALLKKARCHIIIVTRVQAERYQDKALAASIASQHRMDVRALEYVSWRAHGTDFPKVMHPQPIADGEVDHRILRHPQVIIDFQAERGIDARLALAIKSLEQLGDPPKLVTPSPAKLIVIRKRGLTDHYRAILDRKGERSHPINKGYVFDHFDEGDGENFLAKCREMEWLPKANPPAIGLLTGIPSKRMGRKDRLSIEIDRLPDEALNFARLLCRSVTVNIMDGEVATKCRIRVPRFVVGPNCPDPDCISNKEHEEEARHPVMETRNRGRDLKCICDGRHDEKSWRRHNGFERPTRRLY